MKKLLSISLVLLLITSCLTFISVSADEVTSEDGAYTFTLDENGNATLTSALSGALNGAITIPAEIDGHKVVEIGPNAFELKSGITSIRIPSSVKLVEQNAFAYMSDLTSVYFEDGTEQIGRRVFMSCYALSSVRLPNTLKIIEHSAFASCKGLTSITIPKSVEIISAVLYTSDFTTHEVGGAFANSGITSVTFESDSNLKTIGELAFSYSKLASITIPASVEEIKESAFRDSYIQSVKFEENSNLKTIGTAAFIDCEYLSDISIPKTINEIEQLAFYNCKYYNDDANWENNVLYIDNYLICGKDGATFGEYSVKEGTLGIADRAFQSISMEKLNLPTSVRFIGAIAFQYTKLTEVNLNEGLKYIGINAFNYCKLTKLTIPSTVEKIDKWAFYEMKTLLNVTVLSKNVEIGIYAFDGSIYENNATQTIYGYKGSTAEKYVEENKDNYVVFKEIRGEPINPNPPVNPTTPTNPKPTTATITTTKPQPSNPTKITIKTPTVKIIGGKRKITIKYKAVAKATGFQVRYKVGKKTIIKNFKTKKSANKIIKSLKKGKYKVQVRAFSKQGKTNIFSFWTKLKTVKVK